MSKYVILYRYKDNYYGCRYIELNDDGTISTSCNGKPIISSATYVGDICENFDEVETWLTEDVFNRMKNTDGTDTFSDVVDMIANGEHKEFETYIRESELEKICEEYALNEKDAIEALDVYNNDYFDVTIIANMWNNVSDIADNYINEYSQIESWITDYIDFHGLGEALIEDNYFCYELADGRVVEYSY